MVFNRCTVILAITFCTRSHFLCISDALLRDNIGMKLVKAANMQGDYRGQIRRKATSLTDPIIIRTDSYLAMYPRLRALTPYKPWRRWLLIYLFLLRLSVLPAAMLTRLSALLRATTSSSSRLPWCPLKLLHAISSFAIGATLYLPGV